MLPVRLPSYPVLPHPTPSYTRFFNQPTLFYPIKPPRLLPSYPMEPHPTWSYTSASCNPTLFSTILPHPTQSYLIQPHPSLASSTIATLSYLSLYPVLPQPTSAPPPPPLTRLGTAMAHLRHLLTLGLFLFCFQCGSLTSIVENCLRSSEPLYRACGLG